MRKGCNIIGNPMIKVFKAYVARLKECFTGQLFYIISYVEWEAMGYCQELTGTSSSYRRGGIWNLSSVFSVKDSVG